MKKIINRILGCGLLLLLITACTKDEVKYDTSVIREYDLQLNGEPWNINVGITTRPFLFIKKTAIILPIIVRFIVLRLQMVLTNL
ncbi:MAG: hypothetical protein QG594_1018 [Bacteroidota bacterium]|nr:hypothetical protein [Bacteroidota bacterium]